MSTPVLTPIGGYLKRNYEPKADLIDGVVKLDPVGKPDPGDLKRNLITLLGKPVFETFLICSSELRVQVSESRFRVPDLCLLREDAPYEEVVTIPPMLCIEILSREDNPKGTQVKVKDYLAMGVPEVWILDPEGQTVEVWDRAGNQKRNGGLLTIPGTDLEVSIPEIFRA